MAADAKYRYISETPGPFVYVPMAQHPVGDVTFFVRHAPGHAPDGELRAAMAQVEPSVPVMFVQSFDQAIAIGLTPQRLTAWMAGLATTSVDRQCRSRAGPPARPTCARGC